MRQTPVFVLLALAGCTPSPASIQAVAIPPDTYATLSCDALTVELATVSTALADVSRHQESAHASDIAGVLWLGLPLAAMTGGNHSTEIAQLKGQQIAIQQASTKCSTPQRI